VRQEFSADTMVARIAAMYEELLSRRGYRARS
jgi:hypothetical protein